jgi:ABC-2 type transport system ATP-binding protein
LGKTKTILLSTHIMQEVEAVCDRVIIINQGEIVADAPISELKNTVNEMIKKSTKKEYSIEEIFQILTKN